MEYQYFSANDVNAFMSGMIATKRFAFALLTLLFFVWGFVHNLDPILIPHLKACFSLSVFQSSLVDSSVFIAYFVMAIPAGILIKRYGYQKAIIFGLVLFAAGSFLFVPAANSGAYIFFLVSLFTVACGLAVLETAANPYTALMGEPDRSEQYLNFAQSFNGLAATLAPIIGARIILMNSNVTGVAAEASTIKIPYLALGCVIVLLIFVFSIVKLPRHENESDTDVNILKALRHPQLLRGLAAQFFYVGAQVCVFSFFILYAVKSAGIDKIKAADYLGWGCGMMFMVGRFFGTWLMRFIAPARLLLAYATINTCLAGFAVFSSGLISIYSIIAIAFFMSIMFPTIFSLGIKGLGKDTEAGSSLMIMSIVGGALLPMCFGFISDLTGDIQIGYFVPLTCFGVVAWFALRSISLADATVLKETLEVSKQN